MGRTVIQRTKVRRTCSLANERKCMHLLTCACWHWNRCRAQPAYWHVNTFLFIFAPSIRAAQIFPSVVGKKHVCNTPLIIVFLVMSALYSVGFRNCGLIGLNLIVTFSVMQLPMTSNRWTRFHAVPVTCLVNVLLWSIFDRRQNRFGSFWSCFFLFEESLFSKQKLHYVKKLLKEDL